MTSVSIVSCLFSLAFFVLMSSVGNEAVAIGLRMELRQQDTQLYRSLSRKMLALTGSRHIETIADIVGELLDQDYEEGGGVVFLNPNNGEYYLVKGELQQESDPFSQLAEYLAQQRLDGLVFALSEDGFYSGMYKDKQREIRYNHHPMQLSQEDYFSFVSDDAYYQDLRSDLLASIINIEKEGINSYFSVIKSKLVAGKDFNLFDLLKLRDSLATANAGDELFTLFEYFFIASLKRNGRESIPRLQDIEARVATLEATALSFSATRYLSFDHKFGWNHREFESYLLGNLENIGSDSIARLRLMENDLPHLRPVLDGILEEVYLVRRANFEQALVEVSRVFHMLDIDYAWIADRERVNVLLSEVAKRKNKVLHQYFYNLVLRWDRILLSGQDFLQRIRFIEHMILQKRGAYQHQQTVRDSLEELGIHADVYLDYTSNLDRIIILQELEAWEVTDRERYLITSRIIYRYNENARRIETIDMLSNIATAIQDNFTSSLANTLTSKFLSLHPDVAIVKKDVKDKAHKKKTEAVRFTIIVP